MFKKIGIGVIIIIGVTFLAILILSYRLNSHVLQEVTELYSNIDKKDPPPINENDIKHLPAPVQRYLRYTGIIGKSPVRTVRLTQTGAIRTEPGAEWMPFTAVEYYNTQKQEFIWDAHVRAAPGITLRVQDQYTGEKGLLVLNLLSAFEIDRGEGPNFDQGELLRYFNEMMWFPWAFADKNISWKAIDDNSARATLHHKDLTVSAVLHFNKKNQLVNFISDRFRFHSLEKWSVPVEEYREFNGIMVPTKGFAVWHPESGDFPYVKIELTGLEYNKPEPY
ncbi:MAG: hypothetical protein GY754_27645 [bacterium]|nr:hypothetical protein [bacterium]